MFIHFYDMNSGGTTKVKPYEHIFIEADDLDHAKDIFRNMFDRDPDGETCSCCGSDYSITEGKTLEEVSDYWNLYPTFEEWLNTGYVLLVANRSAS